MQVEKNICCLVLVSCSNWQLVFRPAEDGNTCIGFDRGSEFASWGYCKKFLHIRSVSAVETRGACSETLPSNRWPVRVWYLCLQVLLYSSNAWSNVRGAEPCGSYNVASRGRARLQPFSEFAVCSWCVDEVITLFACKMLLVLNKSPKLALLIRAGYWEQRQLRLYPVSKDAFVSRAWLHTVHQISDWGFYA